MRGYTLGIIQGSISLCRYKLLGAGRKIGMSELNSMIDNYKSGPIKLASIYKEEVIGWVRPSGIDTVDLPPDAAWDMSHCQVDDGFILRMRIEKRKVPAQLMQLIYKQKFFAESEASGKPPGPKARREMRDQLKLDLTAKALPVISHIEAYWSERSGDLMLFTTSRRAREHFEQLFHLTFASQLDQTLIRIDPPLMGLSESFLSDSSVATETIDRLSLTTPAIFAESVYP
jgi:hypothetical protein